MTALAATAGRTRRIKFGVNVIAAAMRDPVLLAKQCATIDVLSEGRMLPGFGIGSPRGAEWDAMHLDRTTRGRKTDEALEIISRLWKGENLTYDGKHFRLTRASISRRPTPSAKGQRPSDPTSASRSPRHRSGMGETAHRDATCARVAPRAPAAA